MASGWKEWPNHGSKPRQLGPHNVSTDASMVHAIAQLMLADAIRCPNQKLIYCTDPTADGCVDVVEDCPGAATCRAADLDSGAMSETTTLEFPSASPWKGLLGYQDGSVVLRGHVKLLAGVNHHRDVFPLNIFSVPCRAQASEWLIPCLRYCSRSCVPRSLLRLS